MSVGEPFVALMAAAMVAAVRAQTPPPQLPAPRCDLFWPDAIVWLVDGMAFAAQYPGDWSTAGLPDPLAPFDQPFHLVPNLAVGGHLPERRNSGSVPVQGFPNVMAVDWMWVWQYADKLDSSAPCPTIRN